MRQFMQGLALAALMAAGTTVAAEQSSDVEVSEATAKAAPVATPATVPMTDNQKELVDQAQVVAQVQVTHVNSLINQALSLPGMLSVEGFSYQVSIERQWKGEMNTGEELRIDLNHCTKRLQKDERYVIMAERQDQQWVSHSCEQVVSVVEGGALVAYLQDLFAPQLAQQ